LSESDQIKKMNAT